MKIKKLIILINNYLLGGLLPLPPPEGLPVWLGPFEGPFEYLLIENYMINNIKAFWIICT